MKNVLIHLHPDKCFDFERAKLARIQIDNSLDLGWKAADILLVTNFPYAYNGLNAMVVDGSNFCEFKPRSTNTVLVPHLFDLGLIEKNETYWVHDFDAYQEWPFSLTLKADAGFTTYGWSSKWCLGSFFFRHEAEDVFRWLKSRIYQFRTEDERALVRLTNKNFSGINDRYETLNITYNFGMRHLAYNWKQAEKPLKVLHFHPFYRERGGLHPLSAFRDGENELGFPLMSDRLAGIFKHHEI